MSYIGSSAAPMVQAFSGPFAEQFNGGVSSITLSRSVSKTTDITVVVNNVAQSPFDGSYSVSNKTLTLAETVSAGVGNIYVRYNDAPVASIAPIDGSVTPTKLSTGGPTWNQAGDLTAIGGLYAQNPFTGTYTDGAVLDYTNGTGRITVGAGDGFKIRNGGPGSPVDLFAIDSSGNVALQATLAVQSGSTQYPSSINVSPSTHATSRRASVVLDTWTVAQDTGGSGTKDFGLYSGGFNNWGLIIDTSANLKFNSGYGSPATAYGCRAWVNFDGSAGSVVVKGSGNISSVTRTGTGRWNIAMTNAMPDLNYSIGGQVGGTGSFLIVSGIASSSTFGISSYANSTYYDNTPVTVQVFR